MLEQFNYPDGTIEVRLKNSTSRHRPNGPSRMSPTGYWSWSLHDCPHRYYGPSRSTGDWWIHGTCIK